MNRDALLGPDCPNAREDGAHVIPEPPTPPPYPAPEQRAIPFDPATLSARTSIRQLWRLAHDLGWSVAATYSRGNRMYDNGQPGPVVDCVLLKLAQPGARYAVARWERRDGKSYALEMARTSAGYVNWEGLKAYVRGES